MSQFSDQYSSNLANDNSPAFFRRSPTLKKIFESEFGDFLHWIGNFSSGMPVIEDKFYFRRFSIPYLLFCPFLQTDLFDKFFNQQVAGVSPLLKK